MRLRTLVVALAGLGISGSAFALTPMAVNGFLSNPNSCTNWIIGGAATYMEPLGNNLDYANTVTETSAYNASAPYSHDGLGTDSKGIVTTVLSSTNVVTDEHDISPDFGWGEMGLIDYRFPQTTNDVELSNLHFSNGNDDSLSTKGTGAESGVVNYNNIGESVSVNSTYSGINPRGNTLTVGDVDQNLISGSNGVSAGFINGNSPLLFKNVEGDVNSDFDTVNLEVGHTFNDGRLGIRIHGGAQYGRIESQELVTASNPIFPTSSTRNGNDCPTITATETGNIVENNDSDSQFNGIGPRAGIGATFDLGSGFSLYADSGLNLLVGDTDTTATSVATGSTSQNNGLHGDEHNATLNTSINQSAVYSSGDSTTVVPGGDAEAGISYTAAIANNVNLTGQVGYMVAGYVDPINHVFATDTKDNWTDFGLQGAYAGLDLSF